MNDTVHEGGHPRGHVEVICGSMFSGKTEELLRRIRRAEIAKQRVQIFFHPLGTLYGSGRVLSHNGPDRGALPVQGAEQLLNCLDPKATVVVIDDAQFFDGRITDVVNTLAERGIRVIVAGVDTDFRGEPFGPMPALMAQAEQVDKIAAICVVCGAPASRTQRLINGQPAKGDNPVILVGASEVYEARCRHCHKVPGHPTKTV